MTDRVPADDRTVQPPDQPYAAEPDGRTRRDCLRTLGAAVVGGTAAGTASTAIAQDEPSTDERDGADGDGSVADSSELTPMLSLACDGTADPATLETGQTVCDLDGDGNYMDTTGDSAVTNSDVTEFFLNQHTDPWDSRADLFDFDGDGVVGQGDVIELFASI